MNAGSGFCFEQLPRTMMPMLRTFALALLLLVLPFTAAADITGQAHVIDGDTLEVDGQRIRLHGIDAPELGQTCWDDQGEFPCGLHVKRIVSGLLAARPVSCRELDRDQYGRIVAVCRYPDGQDIGQDLVRHGWAMAYRRYSTDYVHDENWGRELGFGLWKSKFTAPWEWRKMMRDAD